MAHELGHNLAMNHDFIDPYTSPKTIYRDANGVSCTDDHGVMDYYVKVEKWSTCSVERFSQHFNNVILEQGRFCMPQIGQNGLDSPGNDPSKISLNRLHQTETQCKRASLISDKSYFVLIFEIYFFQSNTQQAILRDQCSYLQLMALFINTLNDFFVV